VVSACRQRAFSDGNLHADGPRPRRAGSENFHRVGMRALMPAFTLGSSSRPAQHDAENRRAKAWP